MEKKKLPFSKAPHDDRNLPDIHLGLYNDVIVFDHVEKVFLYSINNTLCLARITEFRILVPIINQFF